MAAHKILKLRSGESIITKIVGKKSGRLMLENPMLMKVTTVTDPFYGIRREILTLSNWLEYTKSTKIAIPEDWIALFLVPDDQAMKLYQAEVDRPEISMEDVLKQQKEQMEKMQEQMDISQIMMSFAIDENMFKKLVEEGILEEGMEFEDMMDVDGSHEDLEIQEPPRKGDEEDFGNHWRDWSPDIREYL